MLKLITGKARSGKTGRVIREIADAVQKGCGNRILIVPEQYSHEAERELCRVCGDHASLYAEVLSFTGLARRVAEETGGAAGRYLDNGGRLLCMACALNNIKERLEVYGSAARKAELQAILLRAVDEMKAACITPESLNSTAVLFSDGLGNKLRDLELILASYDAVVSQTGLDPSDRLTRLQEGLSASSLAHNACVYVDGFTDFTAQELAVLEELLRLGVTLTVCLTMDGPDDTNEIYALSRSTARQLIALAEKHHIMHHTFECSAESEDPLSAFAEHLFIYNEQYNGDPTAAAQAVSLVRAGSMVEECEYAAARAIALVRDTGCRWRDIAIAIRGFEDYRTTLEGTFRFYNVPLFTTRKSSLMSRPLPALISNASRIITTGWQPEDVAAYLRTGLTGLTRTECDTLENYVFLWKLAGQDAWTRSAPWGQHPGGYGKKETEASAAQLQTVNELRHRLARPLKRFADSVEKSACGEQYCEALAALLKELSVPQQLEERAGTLRENGEARLADEYEQMWRILVSALEQCHAILGSTPMTFEEFSRLFEKLLSGYDIGTIPVSLDRVSAGDFDRMRRRNIRHLIVLGAADSRLPGRQEEGGVFTEEERRRLTEAALNLGDSEAEAWREFSLIHHCLSLPSDTLTLSYAASETDGSSLQPSFVMNRAPAFFKKSDLKIHTVSIDEVRLSAPGPALTAAAEAIRLGTGPALDAAPYFRRQEPERWQRLSDAAAAAEQDPRLSSRSVTGLYGKSFRLGATRVENFSDCQFGYFCKYGLKAEARKPAEFSAMEMGTFMHFVLEHVAGEVREKGGFSSVTDDELRSMTDRYVEQYIREELKDFSEKSPRFIHVFRRLESETRAAVLDMAAELRFSDFQPLAFELNFGDWDKLPSVEFGSGEDRVVLNGVADRVDGWRDGDTLYLRVADYKSGSKEFSFSDIYHGKGLQMLLYLFALTSHTKVAEKAIPAEERDGITTMLPAGVIYVPLRGKFITVNGQDEEAAGIAEGVKKLRRSGAVLDDPAIHQAWDNSPDRRYTPVKEGSRSPGEHLATLERLNALEAHIEEYLSEMAAEIRRGSIAAEPRVDGKKRTCDTCDYTAVCGIQDKKDAHLRPMEKYSAARVWELLGCGEKNADPVEDPDGKGDSAE